MTPSSAARSVDKIELHCHADGLIDPAMARELAARGVALGVDPDALEEVVPARSMLAWERDYAPRVAAAVTSPELLTAVIEAHVRRLTLQNVRYAELMVSGILRPSADEGPVLDDFRRIREGAARAGAGRIQVELLVAIGRGPLERARRQVARILTLARHDLIVGVAIAGRESACTIASLAPVVGQLRDAGLGIEIHAGETCGPESVRDAIEHGRPDRIGHAVTAFEDERLVDELCQRDVHIELCVTSNLRLGVVADVARHPIHRARELGMNFSVNTDDPGPFDCSLVSELELLERQLGFTTADFERIRANAWRSRFRRRAE